MSAPETVETPTSTWRRVLAGRTTIDFVGGRRRWFTISAVLIGIALAGLALRGGLNLGLEFRGGLAVETINPAGAGIPDLRDALEAVGEPDARIQLIDDGAAVLIQTEPVSADTQEALVEAVAAVTGSPRTEISIESVGPTFGAIVARRALEALVVFLAAAIVFISWRLEWKMAVAGITALFHDLVITLGVYAITGFEVTPATVVAVLTILGYSLYDTVVVFDKVEELEASMGDQHTITDIVNRAMNQVLVRSINTSLTSLLPVGSLLFVGSFILGAASLRDFALALFVGIAAGTYSSIFVAAPMLGAWKESEEEWAAQRQRLERRAHKARQQAARLAEQAAEARAAKEAKTSAPPRPGQLRPPKKRKKKRRR